MKCLFIGGDRDGDWIEVDPVPVIRTAEETYHRVSFYLTGRGPVHVYAPPGMRSPDVFERLLHGYKQGEK